MDHRLVEALANTALLVVGTVGLWLFWRSEARKHPEAFAPLAPLPDSSVVAAELVAERRKALALAEDAANQLRLVDRAFQGGLRDGRHR